MALNVSATVFVIGYTVLEPSISIGWGDCDWTWEQAPKSAVTVAISASFVCGRICGLGITFIELDPLLELWDYFYHFKKN
jgi:hypothetical protein